MPNAGELRPLTGIRGVAAVYVVVYHYLADYYLKGTHGSILAAALQRGYLSVDLFFVLSGFVMALNYGRSMSAQASGRVYLDFLGRRIVRIYPLFLAVTLLMIVVHATTSHADGPFEIACNILMIHAWGLAASIGGPTWSLSTEFAAYLIFPVLASAALRSRPRMVPAIGLLCLLVLLVVATRGPDDLKQFTDGVPVRNGPLDVASALTFYPLLRCLSEFTLGMLAFRLWQGGRLDAILSRPWFGDMTFAFIIAMLFIPATDLLIVVAFMLLIMSVATGRSMTARLLATGPLHWLGLISYSIYLIHEVPDILFRSYLRQRLVALHVAHDYTISAVIQFFVCLVLAYVSYRLIEKPGRSYGRALLGAWRKGAEPEPTAP